MNSSHRIAPDDPTDLWMIGSSYMLLYMGIPDSDGNPRLIIEVLIILLFLFIFFRSAPRYMLASTVTTSSILPSELITQ